MREHHVCVAMLILCCAAVRASAQPARAEPTAGEQAVLAAIDTLTQEIVTSLDDPDRPTRDKCNFFVERPNPHVTPALILAALDRRDDADVRVRCYVDWQLLSGLPQPLDAQTPPSLVQLYRNAPRPLLRPGVDLDQAAERESEQVLMRTRQDEVAQLDAELQSRIAATEAANVPILAYRDELFRRLPDSAEKWSLGLEDAWARAQAGVSPSRHLSAVIKGIEAWSINADRHEILSIAEMIIRLRDQRPPSYYTSVYWQESSRRARVRTSRVNVNSRKQLDELLAVLEEQLNRPREQMRFRDGY